MVAYHLLRLPSQLTSPKLASRVAVIVAIVAIAVYHWRFTSWGLKADFTLDDMMNMGQSMRLSIWELLRDIVFFFLPCLVFRPLGELWYRLIYEIFGLSPLAFRINIHLLLAINIFLAYRFFRLAGGKMTVALLATLLVAHHHELSAFYFNSGFVFDILCFLFYFLAANFYLSRRIASKELSRLETAGFLALFILAMDAKEIGMTLPTVLFAVELMIPGRWTRGRIVPLAVAQIAALAFVLGRVYGPHGISAVGSYGPEFTLSKFLFHGERFLNWYFLQYHRGQPWLIPSVLALVIGLAVFSKNRVPLIGLAVAFIGVLPVIFIDRGMAQAYIPFAGWTLACAWTVNEIFSYIFRSRVAHVLAFAWVYWLLWTKSAKYQLAPDVAFIESRQVMPALADLKALDLHPPRFGRILMLADPFPHSRWTTTFMFVLLNHDYTIAVDWASEIKDPDRSKYFAVLTTVDGHVRRAE